MSRRLRSRSLLVPTMLLAVTLASSACASKKKKGKSKSEEPAASVQGSVGTGAQQPDGAGSGRVVTMVLEAGKGNEVTRDGSSVSVAEGAFDQPVQIRVGPARQNTGLPGGVVTLGEPVGIEVADTSGNAVDSAKQDVTVRIRLDKNQIGAATSGSASTDEVLANLLLLVVTPTGEKLAVLPSNFRIETEGDEFVLVFSTRTLLNGTFVVIYSPGLQPPDGYSVSTPVAGNAVVEVTKPSRRPSRADPFRPSGRSK